VTSRVALLLAFVLLLCRIAHADGARAPDSRAEALFEEGVRLLEHGDYAEACARLAESHRLAPAGGTALDLGYCNEKLGRLASALRAYEDALHRAESAGRADRVQIASRKLDALTARVPRLRVRLEGDVATLEGLSVAIDEVALSERAGAVPVDAGEHTVTVRARGRLPLSRSVDVRDEGAIVELVVDALAPAPLVPAAVQAPPPATRETPRASWSGRKTLSVGLGSVGIALLGVGTVAGIEALDSHAKSNRLCPTGPASCSPGGGAAEDSARTWGWVSSGALGVGLVLVASAAYLWFTAPRPACSASVTSPLAWQF